MSDPASVPLFRLEVTRLRRHFTVRWLRGTEAISQLYSFDLEIINDGADFDPAGLMYEAVFIRFEGDEAGFHGQIHRISRSHYRPGPARYRLHVGPRMACLQQRDTSRIFQQLSVPQIVTLVLEEHGLRRGGYRFELKADCRKRELCTQYNETDLELVQRLLGEEGLHYHFCHTRRNHELIIGQGLRGFGRSPDAPWRRTPQQAGITHFCVSGSGQDTPGSRASERAEGASNLPFVRTGQLLPLTGHPVAEWNHMWLITRVEHHAAAPGDRTGGGYTNRFQAIPWEVGFCAPRPLRERTPDLRRAWVLGRDGEEAERDRFQRVKVQFDLSSQGLGARYSDCWLPLAPGLSLPMRAGMPVAVGFIGGDMERPLIVGELGAGTDTLTAPNPLPVEEQENVRMQIDWQMLLGDSRTLRVEGGPTLDLHSHSELTVSVGASQMRLDANGLTLISPQVTFAGQTAGDPEVDESAREPAAGSTQTHGDAAEGQPPHESEQQEGQP